MGGTVGVLATGRLSMSPTWGKLMGRRLVATVAGVEAIGILADREVARLGGEQAEWVVVLGNGAGWIDPVVRDPSPGLERRMDGWHLLKRTREAVRVGHGGDGGGGGAGEKAR
jgi:hypothetical protein